MRQIWCKQVPRQEKEAKTVQEEDDKLGVLRTRHGECGERLRETSTMDAATGLLETVGHY